MINYVYTTNEIAFELGVSTSLIRMNRKRDLKNKDCIKKGNTYLYSKEYADEEIKRRKSKNKLDIERYETKIKLLEKRKKEIGNMIEKLNNELIDVNFNISALQKNILETLKKKDIMK